MNFIQLTSVHTGKSFWVNPQAITRIHGQVVQHDAIGTLVGLVGPEDEYLVKETPEDIFTLISELYKTDPTDL